MSLSFVQTSTSPVILAFASCAARLRCFFESVEEASELLLLGG